MAVDESVCLQAIYNGGRWMFLLQKTEDLLSPVSTVDSALVDPRPTGGGPVVCAENASTIHACDAAGDAVSTREASAPQVRPCRFFLGGSNCRSGENCRYLHSFSSGADDFYLVATVEGFRKPIVGIALPSGATWFAACTIDTLKTWDCASGQCTRMSDIGDFSSLGSYPRSRFTYLVSIGSWVFIGIPGVLKVWNTGVDLSLEICGCRRVYAVALDDVKGDKFLFAGLQEGSILVWRWNPTGKDFEAAMAASCSLAGAHRQAIRSLAIQGERLYSGSMDHTIKVWDLANLPSLHHLARLQCLQTLTGHSDAVTSLVFWGPYLLSGSLDKTVRAWDTLKLEQIYEHKEKARVLALCGIMDAKSSPVLMCSCDDFTVYLYSMPSFAERGRIFSGDEVKHIVTGPEGLFFTGNESGELKVWKWNRF